MGYSLDFWRDRLLNRSDLSTQVSHLTRAASKGDPLNTLFKILEERRLIGSKPSKGFICGRTPAVCFQDVPPYSLGQNVNYEYELTSVWTGKREAKRARYLGIGLSFPKPYLFKKGGRPVIYDQTEKAKEYLPQDEWWRIVNFDLSDPDALIDWTHEREWRVPNDFDFELSKATLLLHNESVYSHFVSECKRRSKINYLDEVRAVVVLSSVLY